ncbi:MAG: helix-turn-helix transcriptional regulator [Pikeienuella sp.]
MPRADRLLRLIHEMRLSRPPVTAAALAEAMDVSERTIYRDIDALRSSGARIDGEAGLGYTLTEDPALPPQMFAREEIEALVLGLGEVSAVADPALADAAASALAKIRAALPPRLQAHLEHAVLRAVKFRPRPNVTIDAAVIRQAAWEERALDIDYRDINGQHTTRRIYPLSIMFLDDTLVLVAWCCLRQDDRMFRLDRIQSVTTSEESFRPRRATLLREALRKQGAPPTAQQRETQ